MATTMLDSVIYGGVWASAALAPVFDEVQRTRDLLEILAVLAEVEGEHALIPAGAARAIAATARALPVDAALLDELRRGREASGHSTAGLLRALASRCPGDAGEWVHFGATVQDLTDTWLARALAAARAHFDRELDALDATLCALAAAHRDTLMLGRTHGQHGPPITFGFKVAGWIVELRRHRARLAELRPRLEVAQLAGGVGSLSALGPRALAVQAAFAARLGLRAPAFTWTASRDVIAEWAALATLICGTADRVGHEIYTLQRPEIAELGEGGSAAAIGSLTMPHKQNPEASEHLGTLARLVRHLAGALLEGLVHDHERDGRAWKVEWHAVPELTLLAGRAIELWGETMRLLVVHADRMRANLEATRGLVLSEALMLALALRAGRETAHRIVYDAIRQRPGASLAEIAATTELDPGELRAVLDYGAHTGACRELVDRVLAERSRA